MGVQPTAEETAGAGRFSTAPASPRATFGAVVEGLDLRSLDDATVAALRGALAEHGVLILHGAHLDRDEHVAVASRFGDLDEFDTRVPNVTPTPWVARPAGTKVVVEPANVDAAGALVGRPGETAWRSDGSFKPRPVTTTLLAAVEVRGTGFTTHFADLAAAYDALPDVEKEALADLEAWHSAVYVKARAGAVDVAVPEDPCDLPGAAHPLVRAHPLTGRRALFVGENACHILGTAVEPAQTRLATILDEACRPPRVLVHEWQEGDLVVWDGRRVVHRTPTWDVGGPVRLRHISVIGPEGT